MEEEQRTFPPPPAVFLFSLISMYCLEAKYFHEASWLLS